MPTRHDCSSAQAQRCASKDHFVISDRTQHSRDRYGVCSSGIEEEEETCAAAAEGEAQRGEALCVDISLPGDSQHVGWNVNKVATPDDFDGIPMDQN
eukprot:CCRYP_014510-RA/>CCRYP_014510-RA protein AED:0.00 eAED:0.00 QI:0/-1/0/1/-1/1/1/961/96